jgi:hypothetical protein
MPRKSVLSVNSRRRIQTLKVADRQLRALALETSKPVGLREADDLLKKFAQNYAKWLTRLSSECLKLAASTEAAARDAVTAIEVETVEKVFDAQYLLLQVRMQNENRSYTAVSNIMKTRHDTAKNSIGNIR